MISNNEKIDWSSGPKQEVLIYEQEFSDQSHVELLCNTCHTYTLVTITDQSGNSDLFCKRCSTVYSQDDDTIRHRQRLLPPDEPEPAASTTPTIGEDAVAIRHPPTLKGGAAELAKRGTRKFTYYCDSGEH